MAAEPVQFQTTAEIELVRRAAAGRHDAFDELIERYERRATSVAYRLLGNLHDALEVCQEAFIRAYRGLSGLDDPRRFGPWLLRIVTNLSLNRRRRRSPKYPVSVENGTIDEQPAPDLPSGVPGSSLAARELVDLIRSGLADLPERQRAALVLFSVEQLPQKRVAEILGCSVEAVKWHVFQARRRLRVHLADYLQN